ncbi:hypothetical protein pb186bvf_001395 [Paramecium bursaria]
MNHLLQITIIQIQTILIFIRKNKCYSYCIQNKKIPIMSTRAKQSNHKKILKELQILVIINFFLILFECDTWVYLMIFGILQIYDKIEKRNGNGQEDTFQIHFLQLNLFITM